MSKIVYFNYRKSNILFFGDEEKIKYIRLIDNKWEDATKIVMDRIVGFDDSEPEGSPYRYGNDYCMIPRNFMTKEEAEKMIGMNIKEEELIKLL